MEISGGGDFYPISRITGNHGKKGRFGSFGRGVLRGRPGKRGERNGRFALRGEHLVRPLAIAILARRGPIGLRDSGNGTILVYLGLTIPIWGRYFTIGFPLKSCRNGDILPVWLPKNVYRVHRPCSGIYPT